MSDDVRIKIGIEADAAAASTKKLAAATKELSVEEAKAAKATKDLQSKLDSVQKGARELGQAVGIVSPQLGQLGAAINDLAGATEFISKASPAAVEAIVGMGLAAVGAIAVLGPFALAWRELTVSIDESVAAHKRMWTAQENNTVMLRKIHLLQLEAKGDSEGLATARAEEESGLVALTAQLERQRHEVESLAQSIGPLDKAKMVFESMTGLNVFDETDLEKAVNMQHSLESSVATTKLHVGEFKKLRDEIDGAKQGAASFRAAMDSITILSAKDDLQAQAYEQSTGVSRQLQPLLDVPTTTTPSVDWQTNVALGQPVTGTPADPAKKKITTSQAFGAAAGLVSGDPSALLAAAGPAGAVLGGLSAMGSASDVKKQLDGFTDSMIAALEALPEILSEVIPDFVETLITEMIPALITASPKIFAALITGLMDILNPFDGGKQKSYNEKSWLGKTVSNLGAVSNVARAITGGNARSSEGSGRGNVNVHFNGPVIGSSDSLVRNMERNFGTFRRSSTSLGLR